MFDTERLLIFLDVIECGGFTAAAALRKQSKAAISKQITTLEKECGVQLIKRSTRALQLTEVGVQVFEKSKELKHSLKEIETIFSGFKMTPQGHFKVFCGRQIAEILLVDHLKEWLDCYPEVTLELEIGERIPDIDKEGFDLVIGLCIQGPPTAIQKKIGTTRYVLCASKDYLDQYGTPSTVDELKQLHFLTHSMRKPNYVITLGKDEVIVKPYLYVNDIKTLHTLALSGMGMIWVHEYVVKKDLMQKRLIEIFPEKAKQQAIPLYMYYPETKHVSATVRSFITYLLTRTSFEH